MGSRGEGSAAGGCQNLLRSVTITLRGATLAERVVAATLAWREVQMRLEMGVQRALQPLQPTVRLSPQSVWTSVEASPADMKEPSVALRSVLPISSP